jgi:GntR family transcriptional repressor for pyruvate dehydrogenase complex
MVRIRPLAPTRKLSRELSEQLAAEIRGGRLPPGARLPTEQALAQAARVSRTVVREAVAALRADGLVTTRQGVGAFVSVDAERAPFRINPDQASSLDMMLEVMELRIGVEIESAGLAATRASATQVRAMAQALEAIEQAADRGESAVDQDFRFHRVIAQATGNPQFARFLEFIGHYIIPRHQVPALPERMGGRRAYLARIQDEHRRIYEAIRDGDSKAAREAMRRHLTRSIERYRKFAADQRAAPRRRSPTSETSAT